MRHGIEINFTLDFVGKNLQDRLEIEVVHRMHEDFAILKNVQLQTYDRRLCRLDQWSRPLRNQRGCSGDH